MRLKNLSFCTPFKGHVTEEDVFTLANLYLQENEMGLSCCISICTDWAKSLTTKYVGFVAQINVALCVSWKHQSTHREEPISERIPDGLKSVLDDTAKLANFIKTRARNPRIV
jgi:hypothetical protein